MVEVVCHKTCISRLRLIARPTQVGYVVEVANRPNGCLFVIQAPEEAPAVTFKELLPLPHRARSTLTKAGRKKPPSSELTSDATMKFVNDFVANQKKKTVVKHAASRPAAGHKQHPTMVHFQKWLA